VDVATVFYDAHFVKYNVSFLGYGFYGDCILNSEANRWMGPKRYDWEGTENCLAVVILNSSFHCNISVTLIWYLCLSLTEQERIR